MGRITFIAGNWKMYKTTAEAREFARRFKELYRGKKAAEVKAAVIAPYTQLAVLVEEFAGTGIGVGAQNVHFADEGAYTGEISVAMLNEIGVDYCIVGHSERRRYFAETDDTVNLKLKQLLAKSNIIPILCVGETFDEREAGIQEQRVAEEIRADLEDLDKADVAGMIIAYEPIWAIGTGKTATPAQAEEMCGFIRRTLDRMFDEETAADTPIIYGGSVKPSNAPEIFAGSEVDGALVGGASLDPDIFMEIFDR